MILINLLFNAQKGSWCFLSFTKRSNALTYFPRCSLHLPFNSSLSIAFWNLENSSNVWSKMNHSFQTPKYFFLRGPTHNVLIQSLRYEKNCKWILARYFCADTTLIGPRIPRYYDFLKTLLQVWGRVHFFSTSTSGFVGQANFAEILSASVTT